MKLKGKTIIELTDVNTKEVTTFEDTNMVTNALNHLLSVPGMDIDGDVFWGEILPVYKMALGGLLLFDKPIEESVENVLPPLDANVIGAARQGYQNTTTSPFCGSYNATESSEDTTNKVVKYVYDFTTSQANGIIESVCLSHARCISCYGASNPPEHLDIASIRTRTSDNVRTRYLDGGHRFNSSNHTDELFLIDTDEDVAWYLNLESPTQFSITKRKAGFSNIGVCQVIKTPLDKLEVIETINLPELSTAMYTDKPSYYCIGYNYDKSDNCLYIYPRIGSSSINNVYANTSFKIYKVNLDDLTKIEEIDMVNTIGFVFSILEGICSQGQFIVSFYDSNEQEYKFASLEIGASTNCRIITAEKDSNYKLLGPAAPMLDMNGRVYWWRRSSNKYYEDIYETKLGANTYGRTSASSFVSSQISPHGFVPIKNNPLAFYDYCSYQSICFFAGYLATINNLGASIEKTSNQTMKITYIIQEVN